jgi:hypothetical protein
MPPKKAAPAASKKVEAKKKEKIIEVRPQTERFTKYISRRGY